MKRKILVVDDEPTLVATLRYNLEREGFEVISASEGVSALDAARASRPNLVVLDLMLPGMDGLEVCRLLRREMTMPILMLTAKTDEVDKVVGLELGADDYVTKPFSMRELVARVRALIRRAETPPPSQTELLTAGDLQVDLNKRQGQKKDQALSLKPKEYDLLVHFLRNRGRAFTREQLLNQIWGHDFLGDSRTVDVHVRWLREKIEDNPGKPTRLITVRGVGYRFDG